jgi:hypothetical protein
MDDSRQADSLTSLRSQGREIRGTLLALVEIRASGIDRALSTASSVASGLFMWFHWVRCSCIAPDHIRIGEAANSGQRGA